MQSGQRPHYARILRPNIIKTPKGDTQYIYPNPEDVAIEYHEYISIEPLQGRMLVVAKQYRSDITHEITMLYRPDMYITDRIAWDNGDGRGWTLFEIASPIRNAKENTLKFYAVEIAYS